MTTDMTPAADAPEPAPELVADNATPLAAEDEASPPADAVAEGDAAERDYRAEITKTRQEAAKYRSRLRETEGERDALRTQLDAQRRAVIDWQATAKKVDPALLDAAGINIGELCNPETGQLSMDLVDGFIESIANRFNIPRGFTPNRAQGMSAGSPPPTKPSIADAFKH